MCACRGTAGFAHVSCLAEQAKILCDEAEENNLGVKVMAERWDRWYKCSLCEQDYHGVVCCALGWACWKTYVGRPEADAARFMAINQLGNGLCDAQQYEAALSVRQTVLATRRRNGASENSILVAQSNLASTYGALGQIDRAIQLERDIYHGKSRLLGEEHKDTLISANNYADSLLDLRRFEEAKALWRRTTPVARRVLGENHEDTLRLRWSYARALYKDPGATLDDLREAVTMLEETERTARRVLGGVHPLTEGIEKSLQNARAALAARDGGDASSVREALRKAEV